jgi:hypothetical protein
VDCDIGDIHERRIHELSSAADGHQRISTRACESAIRDLEALAVFQVHKPFPVGQRLAVAVE